MDTVKHNEISKTIEKILYQFLIISLHSNGEPAQCRDGKKVLFAIPRFKVDEFDEKAIFLCQFCGGEAC